MEYFKYPSTFNFDTEFKGVKIKIEAELYMQAIECNFIAPKDCDLEFPFKIDHILLDTESALNDDDYLEFEDMVHKMGDLKYLKSLGFNYDDEKANAYDNYIYELNRGRDY